MEPFSKSIGSGVFFLPSEESPVSIFAIVFPTSTTSFTSAKISIIVPDSTQGISESTLSVPISRNNSSFSTNSPTFFLHSRIVPSVIDSPIFGITISIIINTPSIH